MAKKCFISSIQLSASASITQCFALICMFNQDGSITTHFDSNGTEVFYTSASAIVERNDTLASLKQKIVDSVLTQQQDFGDDEQIVFVYLDDKGIL